jgi:WD40 repeat protein/transcriptional regulator with XRE-family HTH domain
MDTTIGAWLRERRLAAGLTQEALAERAGISARSIQAIERGTSAPQKDTLQRLAAALGLPPAERARLLATVAPTPRQRAGANAAASHPAGSRAAGVPSTASVSLPRPAAPRNPYKGLSSFREGDAGDFFGRERLSAELVAAVGDYTQPGATRLLVVVGPSGSGKSSAVLAGLLPRLRDGAVPDSAHWVYLPPLTPGAHPLEALSVALASALPQSSVTTIRADLEASARGLHVLAGRAAGPSQTRVLLVVDQAEELFTLTADAAERDRFIDLLVTATTESRGPLVAVLALRADVYDRTLGDSRLGRLVTVQSVPVLPLEPAELRTVLEGPAALPDVGLHFEVGLADAVLDAVRGAPGALPLLQFTLDQLYARRAGAVLTVAAYQALGGMRGALARQAEATYKGLPDDAHRALARALFLRLIAPGAREQDTTRRRVPLAEFELAEADQTLAMRTVAETFITARLVTAQDSGGVTTLEVSHEALIREWPRLGTWVRAAREDIWLQGRLSADAADWETRGRPLDSLYRGTVLVEALGWVERNTPSVGEAAFLAAADEAERQHEAAERERQRRELAVAQRAAEANRRAATRLRMLAGVLAVFVLTAGGLAVWAQANATQATRQRDAARSAQRVALARQLAAQALNRLDSQYDRALLLGVQAYRLLGTTEARVGLLPSLEAQPPGLLAYLGGHTLAVLGLAVSADGAVLASASADGTLRFWDLRRRRPLGQPIRSAAGSIAVVAVSPQGRLVATGDLGGAVQVWATADRHAVGAPLHCPTGRSNALAFSPDGRVLAAACRDGTIRLWETAQRRPLAFSPLHVLDTSSHPDAGIAALTFSPNGRILASGDSLGNIQLWDAATGAPYASHPGELGLLSGHTDALTSLAFSPDSTLLASASADGTIRLWDVAGERPRGIPLPSRGGIVDVLAFSAQGTLAAGSEDGTIRLWDVWRRRALGAPLAGHTGGVSSLAFSPDGGHLASGTTSGTIALWAVPHQRPPTTLLASGLGAVYGLSVSPDGQTLAASSGDGTLRLWDLPHRRLRTTIAAGGTASNVAVSPDGSLLAVGAGSNIPFAGPYGTVNDVWSVYDPASGRLRYEPPWPQVGVNRLAFSPDGTLLALAGVDGTLQFWAVPRQAQGRWHALGPPLLADPVWLVALAFSPDGQMLATGGSDGLIRLWDVQRRRLAGRPLSGHAGAIFALAFNRQGTLLASAGHDQSIRLWDVRLRRPVGAPIMGQTQNALAFSPDGTLLASGGLNAPVRLWDIAAGPQGAVLTGSGQTVTSLVFTPDGRHLFAAGTDGTIRLWDVDLGGWPQRACQLANRNLSRKEWQQYLPGVPYEKTCPGWPAGS